MYLLGLVLGCLCVRCLCVVYLRYWTGFAGFCKVVLACGVGFGRLVGVGLAAFDSVCDYGVDWLFAFGWGCVRCD